MRTSDTSEQNRSAGRPAAAVRGCGCGPGECRGRLTGKRALVTGAGRGIGSAVALRLAVEGADVVVNYRSDSAAAEAVVWEIRERTGRAAIAVRGDVSDPTEAEGVVRLAHEAGGGLDVVVANAGPFTMGRLSELSPAAWDRVIDGNLSSVHYTARAAVPLMRAGGGGTIVAVGLSTMHAMRGAPHVAAYALAKQGVETYVRSLAAEEAAHGIRVCCVNPGLIDNGHLPLAQAVWMAKRVPMGRLGQASEVAAAVAFLVSDEASYCGGAVLSVAGGWDWTEDRPMHHDAAEVFDLFTDEKAG